MKKENKVSASEMLKNELGLTKAESLFCDLYINGGREFAGQHCKCYREAFQDSGSGVSLKSRRLLGKTHISERIKKLSEQQQTDTEAIAVKLQVTETLKSVMEETSTAKYKDKWGMDLLPGSTSGRGSQCGKSTDGSVPDQTRPGSKTEDRRRWR